jgi:hypothetical protein
VLNSCLLFVILFYVYPLKFMSKGIALYILGIGKSQIEYRIAGPQELASLFAIYGAAFAAVFLCFTLLYLHAYRIGPALGITAEQRGEAAFLFRHYLIFAVVGLLSLLIAFSGIGLRWALPGWIYFLLGPACTLHGVLSLRHKDKPKKAAA